MARWRLKGKHYIHVEIDGNPVEWEYKETDQASGRQGRKMFVVPMLLDPEDRTHQNYPGEIIVSNKPYNKDYVFREEPTMEMEPIDDEAEKISASLKHKWVNPIDKIDMNYNENFSTSLLTSLEREIKAVRQHQVSTEPVSLKGIDPEAFAKLQEQVAELMDANAKLQNRVIENDLKQNPLRRI